MPAFSHKGRRVSANEAVSVRYQKRMSKAQGRQCTLAADTEEE
jgi:hypothetical protein